LKFDPEVLKFNLEMSFTASTSSKLHFEIFLVVVKKSEPGAFIEIKEESDFRFGI
jgi:hypothetical protein